MKLWWPHDEILISSRRDGKPTEPACKGSTFKGPFHLPRMLIMCDTMIDQILAK